jgi:hypothetical protein
MKTPARIAVAFALGTASAASSAALLLNGDFETNVIPSAVTADYAENSTEITGWRVVGTTVQLTGSTHLGLSGNGGQWIDLTGGNDGYNKGLTSNAFSTVAGQQYQLTFDLGSIPTAQYGPASVSVSVNGGFLGEATNAPALNGSFAVNWAGQSLSFVADSALTRITIIGSDNKFQSSSTLVGLDNVAVAAVPEPHEWAMMLAGLGLVGWAARRKNGNASGTGLSAA